MFHLTKSACEVARGSSAVAHTRCAAATIIDTVGSAAIATVSGKAGVSVHISADYLSGLEVGETMASDAEVINLGKRLVTAAGDGGGAC